jgi:hypothetical protein
MDALYSSHQPVSTSATVTVPASSLRTFGPSLELSKERGCPKVQRTNEQPLNFYFYYIMPPMLILQSLLLTAVKKVRRIKGFKDSSKTLVNDFYMPAWSKCGQCGQAHTIMVSGVRPASTFLFLINFMVIRSRYITKLSSSLVLYECYLLHYNYFYSRSTQ